MLEVENQTPAPFRLQVLGAALLESEMIKPVTLERKAAALLALLALEGPTSRSRIAGLLWADRLEDVARSNLRQCLRRLRNLTGAELVSSDDTLRLAPDLRVDALRLESLVFTGDYTAALELEGVLLAGLEYDDCPEFEEWLRSSRERLENARREALSAEADRFEREGEFVAALSAASRILERDPISEGAHRRVMRLHYLNGDRSSALVAFARCRETLNSELDLEPSLETLNLAGLIERGSNLPQMVLPARTIIPLSVLRPPVLVGRDPEWQALEAAWEARKVVFIVGDAGIGKSRLMLDFVATKGAFMPHNGRPGDAQIPYSTFSRGLRTIVGGADQPARLPPPWICRELLRLVPEKAARFGMELPAPIGSRDELLRFFDAITEFTRLSPHQWVAFVSDDLQFYDTASFELRMYMSGRLTDAKGQLIRNLVAYRRGALSPAIQALVEQILASDQAVLIDLEALEPPAIQNFLTELQVPGLERFSPAMSRYTGGNPMFVLETLKHLIETDTLEQDFPEHLPPPGRIGALVRQRLELLSAAALRLARVAAIAGTDFTLELGAKVLETNVMDLTEPLVELEQAQVMKAEKFSHDLISEATLEGVPAPIRTLIHRRSAEYLEMLNGEPARIAHHWLEAGDERLAASHLFEAGKAAHKQFLNEDSVKFFEHAASIYERLRQREDEFRVLEAMCTSLYAFDFSERHTQITERMQHLAQTPDERGKACHVRAELFQMLGDGDQALSLAREGLQHVQSSADEQLQAALHGDEGAALWMLGRFEEARISLTKALELTERFGTPAEIAIALANLAVTLETLHCHSDAMRLHKRAVSLFEQNDQQVNLAAALSNLAVCMAEMGKTRDSFPVLLRSVKILERLQGVDAHLVPSLFGLAITEFDLNEYVLAIEHFEQCIKLAEQIGDPRGTISHGNLANVYRELGAFEQALKHLDIATDPNLPNQFRYVSLHAQIACLEALEQPFEYLLEPAELAYQESGRYIFQQMVVLERACRNPSEVNLKLVLKAVEDALERELYGLAMHALTRQTQLELALKQFPQAFESSSRTIELLETYDPERFYRAEILFTQYRALEAVSDPNARTQLETTLAWLLEIADHHVPPEYRISFLTRNPVNREILEAARLRELEIPNDL